MKYLDTILEKYQVRKTKAQKTAFLNWAQQEIRQMGYTPVVEEYKGDLYKCRNLIVGNPEEARVIYTAHYDTQPVMPFPNMVFPKNKLATFGVMLPLCIVMFVLCRAVVWLAGVIGGANHFLSFMLTEVGLLGVIFGFLALLFYGPANQHTANDNTSGTACLMELMESLTEEERKYAAFIFFDQEEKGKVGSQMFAKKYPEIRKNGYVFNLDCIGDGQHMLIVAPRKTPEAELKQLEDTFAGNASFVTEAITAKHASYNSDHRSFKKGYALAALHLHPTWGLHLKRIHTKKDTICEEANIQYAVDGCRKLLKQKVEEI